MAQQGESGASMHLPLDHLGPGVDSLGAAVVMREGKRRRGGLDVDFEAFGKGVDVGQVGGARVGDPLPEETVVAGIRGLSYSRGPTHGLAGNTDTEHR